MLLDSPFHAPYRHQPQPMPSMSGLFRPTEPPIHYGSSSNALLDSMRRRRRNLGAFLESPNTNGGNGLHLPSTHWPMPTSPISNLFQPLPQNIFPHGIVFSCDCQSTLADFEGSFRPDPLFVDTPTATYRAPTLDWTPPPILEALRDVDTNPRWGVESSLEARCNFCGGVLDEEQTQYGINSHFFTRQLFYRMEQAIIDNNWTRLLEWITRMGCTLDMRDSNHLTPLHLSVLHRREKIAQNLVKSGAFINALTIDGYSPLMLAVRTQNQSMVRMFILYDANINLQSSNGVSALGLAIANRHVQIITMLLQNGANANAGFPTPHLHRALWMGPEHIADELWHAGARIDQKDSSGRSALTVAAVYKRRNILLHMLPYASDKALLDSWRRTSRNTWIHREIRRRVSALDAHVFSCLDAWKFPRDVEGVILEYLYKSPPQHNVSH